MKVTIRIYPIFCLTLAVVGLGAGHTLAADAPAAPPTTPASSPAQSYILSPNDVVLLKVFQEDDMETRMRISRDGTATFPLIGGVKIGGKTVDQAAKLIRDLLDKDYLVNPQISLTVVEYVKRRFTVLGQVQKPGSYEIPNEESITLLEAIAMAGGYTRLANPGRITITRSFGGRKISINADGKALAKARTQSFEIQPDDTITVDERIF